jgi:hypothetical protein
MRLGRLFTIWVPLKIIYYIKTILLRPASARHPTTHTVTNACHRRAPHSTTIRKSEHVSEFFQPTTNGFPNGGADAFTLRTTDRPERAPQTTESGGGEIFCFTSHEKRYCGGERHCLF